jgi:hypothetical protein
MKKQGTLQRDGIVLCALALYLALTIIPTLSSQLMEANFCFLFPMVVQEKHQRQSRGGEDNKMLACCIGARR